MILLSNYVNNINEAKRVKSLIGTLRDAGIQYLRDNNVNTRADGDLPKENSKYYSSKHALELFRVYMKSDSDADNKGFLDELCREMSDKTGLDVHVSNYSSKIYGGNESSGKYPSYEIEVINAGGEKERFYISNKNNGTSLFQDKSLVPDNLLPLKSKNTYDNAGELKSAVAASLKSKFSGDKFKGVVSLLIYIMDAITDRKNLKTSSSLFQHSTTDAFFEDVQEGKLVCDLENANVKSDGEEVSIKELLKEQSKSTITYIEKDFGEIIGPLIFLTIFDKSSVTYPTLSNEAIIDYYIDGHKVSAKQMKGGGAAASGVSYFKSITLTDTKVNGSEKSQEQVMTGASDELDNMKPKEEDAKYTDAERFMIESVCETYKLNGTRHFAALAYRYVIDPSEVVKRLPKSKPVFTKDMLGGNILTKEQVSLFNKISGNGDNDIAAQIVGDNPSEFFLSLFKKIGYTQMKTGSIDFEHLTLEEWDKFSHKVGALIYPMLVVAVNNINSIYKNEEICGKDCVTSVINKQIDMKQVYFQINQSDATIDCVASKGSKWMFKTKGYITNLSNGKVAVKLIH